MITASIVTFHTKHSDIVRLLKCVEKSPVDKVYIIDNSSNDELRTFLAKSERVVYIYSINQGYGKGHNVAIEKALEAGSDYHVVLNPDVYWTEDVLGELASFMDKTPDCGLVMPKITYPSGATQYLCKKLPTPVDLIVRRFLPIKSLQKRLDYQYELRWTDYDKQMEVPSLSGCFMFMRCSVLKQIGLFDPRYFMYAEDLDLCRRIGEVSRTIYNPVVSVVHEYEKGSYKCGKLLRYHVSSILKYFNKWGWFFDSKRKQRNNTCLRNLKKSM